MRVVSARVGLAAPSPSPRGVSHLLTSAHRQMHDRPAVPSGAGNGRLLLRSPLVHCRMFCLLCPVRCAMSGMPTRSGSTWQTRSVGSALVVK
jgi:hypothetical protein